MVRGISLIYQISKALCFIHVDAKSKTLKHSAKLMFVEVKMNGKTYEK